MTFKLFYSTRVLSTRTFSSQRILRQSGTGPLVPTTLDIPRIEHPLPTPSSTLVCSLELSGFMPDHLDFIAFFARYSASNMGLSSDPIIHIPTKITKYNTLVSPFVHAKTKQVFESKVHKRCLQIYNGQSETVQEWVEYVEKNLPAGINLKVDTFDWKELGHREVVQTAEKGEDNVQENTDTSSTSETEKKQAFEQVVREKMQAYLEKFDPSYKK